MYDIITIGSATRDVFLISKQFIVLKTNKVTTGIAECMALGSKIEIEDIVFTTGGGATNAAATFASLGLRTAIITRVGNDSMGKDVVEDLSRFGVSTHLVKVIKGEKTAYSTLLTMEDGERTAIIYRGASSSFTKKDLPLSALKQAHWIYLTSLGGNLALSKYIIARAKNFGTKVAWNPGKGEIKKGLVEIKPILHLIDVLIVNKEEATLMTGKKEIASAFKCLHSDNTVRVITDGTNGAYVYRDGWNAHSGTTGVKSISRTGAGDAFGSGFVSEVLRTGDIMEALRVGTLNAESVIQKQGAKLGILKTLPSAAKKRRIKITIL